MFQDFSLSSTYHAASLLQEKPALITFDHWSVEQVLFYIVPWEGGWISFPSSAWAGQFLVAYQ